MGDIVGIIKELREGEKASFESKAVMPVALVKEVDAKGLIRRSQREVPTALMYATNQRLLFLSLPPDESGGCSERRGGVPPVPDGPRVVRNPYRVD